MLEKIGLAPKPSMRGGNWVVDASHCQGCSSQFTFFNRKHHCRRCGGLFCNSCTQQRMILRGQGDSPVLICDPCKKLEDAARFELRYGHKNRSAKGTSKQVQKQEEEVLHQILGIDGKQESQADMLSDLLSTASTSSSSSLKEEPSALGREGDFQIDIGSNNPEELRQQAVEEKKKYRILKGEGKSEEALQAFKHGKELEKQAGALEIQLRKNRRMASKTSNLTIKASNQKKYEAEESSNKIKLPSQRSIEEKNDLAAELRELGWSDADLHDAEKKPVNLSLEGELSNLLVENTPSSSVSRKTGIDKSQVVALKKKALQLKREGKLAEAKEELKRAKILEKQLEEQELLGEAEDSDDELSALIRSMDDDKQDYLLLDHAPIPVINFERILGVGDELTLDDNFDRNDNDMNDPELAAALKSFGWTEEDDEQAVDHLLESNPLDRKALQQEVLSLKREALSKKREGNVAEAMSLLKKAKLLEKDLETMQVNVPKISISQVSQGRSRHQESEEEHVTKLPSKRKLAIQKELLALKKKALALRREGRVEEADEELKKGKSLEQQLEETENAPYRPGPKMDMKNSEINHIHGDVHGAMDLGEEGAEAEVTEQDMHDLALMSVLKNLGWNDDDTEPVDMKSSKLHDIPSALPRRSKAEIQRELLGLKRKALALRRQGKTEEADEELERARDLEKQLADVEAASNSRTIAAESQYLGQDMHDPALMSVLKNLGWNDDDSEPVDMKSSKLHDISSALPRRSKAGIQRELLGLKRKALALRRQGKTEEADEELERARDLEKQLADMEAASNSRTIVAESHDLGPFVPQDKSDTSPEADRDSPALLMGRKLKEQEIDSKGNNKRIPLPTSSVSVPAGTMIDWEALGKPGVPSEEDSTKSVSSMPRSDGGDFFSNNDTAVLQSTVKRAKTSNSHADGFSPPTAPIQPNSRMSAQQNAGRERKASPNSVSPEQSTSHGMDSQKDKVLAHKMKAVALKREGKLAEAREELRWAKLLENSLEGEPLQSNVGNTGASVSTSESTSAVQETRTNQQVQKLLSGRDRFKLQRESLAHKRNALKLRREGKIEESEAELELAKALENQLEESSNQGSNASAHGGKLEGTGDMGVEDLLDPQLLSALKSVGWEDSDLGAPPSKKPDPKPTTDKGGNTQGGRTHLEEMIKAEKVRALNLKREGKQAEALDALRSAKQLEKKLGSLT